MVPNESSGVHLPNLSSLRLVYVQLEQLLILLDIILRRWPNSKPTLGQRVMFPG